MTDEPRVRLLITLPPAIKRFLDDLKRLEGVTTSGYIRQLLEWDLESRVGQHWNPVTGWKELNDPAYQKRMAAAEKRAENNYNRMIRSDLKRKEKEQAKRQSPKSANRRKARR